MEKPSTQKSTVSPATTANERTPKENTHHRLPMNSSASMNKTMPAKPQRNLIHSTSPQNQCAHNSAGQNASTPTLDLTTGDHTPTMGMDGNTPHRDRGTQMLLQEIHTTTITQSTQIPSQQWEQITTNEDHGTEQSTTDFLNTVSQNPSPRLGEYQGTFARQPTHTPALDTGIVNTIGSHQKTFINPGPVIIQTDHEPIQIVDIETGKNGRKTHSVHKEGQNPEDTIPDRELIPKALQTHGNNPQINIGDTTEGLSTENAPHIITTSPLEITNNPRNSSNDGEIKIIARVSQRDEPSETSTTSTSNNKPDSDHTHTDSYTRQRYVNSRTIHTKTRRSKQENTPQPTREHSHRNVVTDTPLGRNSKDTPEPATLIREPVPTQDELQESIADDTTTPIVGTSAQDSSIPKHITVSSSEDGSENDGSQLTAQIDQSTISTPQQENKSKILTSSPTKHYAPQSIVTVNKQDQSSHQGITISDNAVRGVTPKEIQIHMQSPTTITITHRDLNNNNQASARTITPIQQRTTNATISIPTTRGRCNGTLYRLSPIGKSSSPMQQKSPCHTHSQNTSSTTTGSAWELTQTQDPYGINNFHQDPNGKIVITTQGKPRCNYCKHPNHERQRCPFRLRDLQYNIDRRMHPQKGSLGKFTKNYLPKNQGNRSPMSTRLANETDDSDHPRFWQTQCGHIIYSIDNQPQCSYCGIPSHGRDTCQHRRKDETGGLFRIHHPQRGLIRQTEDTQPKSPRNDTIRPSNSENNQRAHNYQLTKDGQYILNSGGYRLCDYCGVPSHPRTRCNARIKDETNGIIRAIHPNRGQLLSGNQRREEITMRKDQTRKPPHGKQEDPHVPKTRPPNNHKNIIQPTLWTSPPKQFGISCDTCPSRKS